MGRFFLHRDGFFFAAVSTFFKNPMGPRVQMWLTITGGANPPGSTCVIIVSLDLFCEKWGNAMRQKSIRSSVDRSYHRHAPGRL